MIARNSVFTDKSLLNDVYEDFISSFGKAAMSMGHKRITGMVFAILFMNEKPMSLDDITDALETSKATTCGTVKELIKLGFIQKSWVKGSRKDYYVAETSINVLIQKALQSMLDSRLSATREFVGRIQTKIDHMTSVGVSNDELKFIQNKISEVKKLNECLTSLISQFSLE